MGRVLHINKSSFPIDYLCSASLPPHLRDCLTTSHRVEAASLQALASLARLFVDQGPVGNPASMRKGGHVYQCDTITATDHALGRVCTSYGDP